MFREERVFGKQNQEKQYAWVQYVLVCVVPGEGFEPPTFGLQNRCTTAVLTRHTGSLSAFRRKVEAWNYVSLIFKAAMNALWGISTWPKARMRFLPSFCFSRSFFLRVMSPP